MKVKPKSKEAVLEFVETIKQMWNDWKEVRSQSGFIEVEGSVCHAYNDKYIETLFIGKETKMYVKAFFNYYNGIANLNFKIYDSRDNSDNLNYAEEALSHYFFINVIQNWMQKFSEIGEVIIDDI